MKSNTGALLQNLLAPRLSDAAKDFLLIASNEIHCGVSARRLAQLLSLASRHVRSDTALEPLAHERAAADGAVAGWDPERWTLLETLRVALLMARPDLADDSFSAAFEHCFRYADHGEQCSLYRTLPLLPQGERFVWRAGEGCRSNMSSVFDVVACDSPYAVTYFNDIAWHQLIIKTIFMDIPLWRVYGLDQRLSPELARMALDLVEERRSAGRTVSPQLWLCLGRYAGERGLQALKLELTSGTLQGQRAALLALARANELACAQNWLGSALSEYMPIMEQIDKGDFTQSAFGRL